MNTYTCKWRDCIEKLIFLQLMQVYYFFIQFVTMTKKMGFFIQNIHFFIILGHFLKHIFNKCMVYCTWQADDFIWKPLLSCALLPWEYIKEMHSSWNMEKKYKCYISFSILSRLYIAILPQWFLFSTWEQFKHGKAIPYM